MSSFDFNKGLLLHLPCAVIRVKALLLSSPRAPIFSPPPYQEQLAPNPFLHSPHHSWIHSAFAAEMGGLDAGILLGEWHWPRALPVTQVNPLVESYPTILL